MSLSQLSKPFGNLGTLQKTRETAVVDFFFFSCAKYFISLIVALQCSVSAVQQSEAALCVHNVSVSRSVMSDSL